MCQEVEKPLCTMIKSAPKLSDWALDNGVFHTRAHIADTHTAAMALVT